jgi:hypothetical protein
VFSLGKGIRPHDLQLRQNIRRAGVSPHRSSQQLVPVLGPSLYRIESMNPTALKTQPWRFMPGDEVYVRGWDPSATSMITGQIHPRTTTLELSYGDRPGRTFPAYFVVDSDGHEWQVPQVMLSRQPVVEKS